MATSPTRRPLTRADISPLRVFFAVVATLAIIAFLVLMTLLSDPDAQFTIPILTPLAIFMRIILTPLYPFVFPIYLHFFLTVASYRAGKPSPIPPFETRGKWRAKRIWVVASACWALQHSVDFVRDLCVLLGLKRGEGWNCHVCAVEKCTLEWVELGLTVVVLGAWVKGWKWDGAWVDKWIEAMAKAGVAAAAATEKVDKVVRMEEGVAGVEAEKNSEDVKEKA